MANNRLFGGFLDSFDVSETKDEEYASSLLNQFSSFSIGSEVTTSYSLFPANASVLGDRWLHDELETSFARSGEATSTTRVDRNDFHLNGCDLELDDYDLYQIRLRSSALSSCVRPSAVLPFRRRQTATRGSHPQQTSLPPNPIKKEPQLYETPANKITHSSHSRQVNNSICVFCRKNGETLSVYGGHVLKDNSGRVTCPILRRYTCPICGATGDAVHTIKYCPQKAKSLH